MVSGFAAAAVVIVKFQCPRVANNDVSKSGTSRANGVGSARECIMQERKLHDDIAARLMNDV